MNDIWLVIGIIWFACGVLAALVAQRRGTDAFMGFLLGVILGPLGVVLAAVQKPAKPVDF